MDIENAWVNADNLEIKNNRGKTVLTIDEDGNLNTRGRIIVNNSVYDCDPRETVRKAKKEMEKRARSAPDDSETEQEIMSQLKGYTRRDAAKLLGVLKANVIADTPIGSTVDEII